MTTAVQNRRGTTAEHATFTGLEGEVTIDTTKDTAVIHDGVLAGGYPLAKENLANVSVSGLSALTGAGTASDDKFFVYDQSATSLKTITRAELNNAMEADALANVTITGGTINGTTIGGTTAAAGTFTQANFADNAKAIFGAGSDLQIYHDGSNSYIDDAGTGDFYIRGSAITRLQSYAGEDMVVAVTNGAVNLYYDASKKLATTSTGIDVTGTATMDGLTVEGVTVFSGTSPQFRLTETDTTDVNNLFRVIGGTLRIESSSDDYLTNTKRIAIDNSTGDIFFYEDTGTTPKFFWDASAESLGIGTSSPAYKLDVSGGDAQIYGVRVGRGAGSVSTNTAVGASALAANTTGTSNNALGYQAMYSNTTASNNTAMGDQALRSNSTGSNNSAFGYQALYSNTVANNTAFGFQALTANTTGATNVAVGGGALYSNTTASNNTAVGYRAGYSNTTGTQNNFLGYQSGYSNTTGGANTVMGHNAFYTNTTGFGNSAFGLQVLQKNTTANYNTAVGYAAAQENTTGTENVAIGSFAFDANTTGSYNTAVGKSALSDNTSGNYNTALGLSALENNTTAYDNTAVGYQALYANTTGVENVAIGAGSLSAVTTGYENIGIGRGAGSGLTTAIRNTFVGDDAGYLITTGNNNTILGRYTGNQGGLDIRTSSNYIVLSDGDGNPRGIFDGSGNFMVNTTSAPGAGIMRVAAPSASAQIQLERTSTSTGSGYIGADVNNALNVYNSSISHVFYVTQTGACYNSTGTYGTMSDIKIKENVSDARGYLNDLCRVRIVKYSLKSEEKQEADKLGVIAQELEEIFPGMIEQSVDLKDGVGEPTGEITKTVKYSVFVPMLIKAVQELKTELDTVKAELATLKGN